MADLGTINFSRVQREHGAIVYALNDWPERVVISVGMLLYGAPNVLIREDGSVLIVVENGCAEYRLATDQLCGDALTFACRSSNFVPPPELPETETRGRRDGCLRGSCR